MGALREFFGDRLVSVVLFGSLARGEAGERSDVEDARILHDRGGFFATVLAGLRERLRELGARRVFLEDGSCYWDLKPDYRFGEIFEI